MSTFASRQSNNNGRRITVRLGGKQGAQPKRPQRFNKRRPQKINRNLGAFLKAPVDRDGFTTVKTRRHRRNRVQSPLVPSKKVVATNSFAVLDRDDSPSPTKQIALPKIVKPKAAMGAWAKKSANVVVEKPIKPRVSFANDSENLMKPTAVETRQFEKDSASNEFIKYPAEEEYLKLKRSKSAWRPKSVPQIKEEKVVEDAKKTLAAIAAIPTYIGSWADACDSDSEDEEDEVVLTVDSLGRPTTDNSAW